MTLNLVASLAILALCTFGFRTSSAQTSTDDVYGNAPTSSDASQADPQTTPATTPTTTSGTTTTTGTMDSSSSSLPSTAGPWPMIALFGVGALGSGLALRRVRR